jgi:hypothetical protein
VEPGITATTLSANEESRREKGRPEKEERREEESSSNCNHTLSDASYGGAACPGRGSTALKSQVLKSNQSIKEPVKYKE